MIIGKQTVEPLLLIPLANILQVEIFRIGERLISEGETPTKLIMLASGSAGVISEKEVSRPKIRSIPVKGLLRKLRNLKFSRVFGNSPTNKSENVGKEPESLEKEVQKPWTKQRTFHFDKIETEDPNEVKYKIHV